MKLFLHKLWTKVAKIEHLWLFLLLLFGCIMVFRMPPFQVMDEYKHFYKAYGVSEGNFICDKDNQDRAGIYLPVEMKYAGAIMGVDNTEYRYDHKIAIEEIERAKGISPSEDREFVVHAFCETPFWSSLPQAIGIRFASIFQFDLLSLFYTGRLFALFFAAAILYWALKILPIGRIFFMAVTLIPMFVQQISSYSLDGMHYALLFLFFAYVLRLALQEEAMTKKSIILLTILSLFAVYAKFGYMLFAFLIFLIPPKKFSSRKNYIATMGGILLLHAIAFFSLRAIFTVGDIVNGGDVNRGKQILWILQHPLGYYDVLMNTLDTHFMFFLRNLFGVLGWLDYTLHGVHYLALGFLLFFLIGSKHEEAYTLNTPQRLLLLSIGSVSAVLLMTILYIIDDGVGAPIIDHMQGKYFLPLLPLLLLGVYNFQVSQRTKMYVLFLVTLLALPSVWFIQQARYYDTRSYDIVPRSETMEVVEVDAARPLQQQLYIRENNLRGISFWIANALQPESSITFQLRDADCVQVIHRGFLRGREIPVPGYYHYRFPVQTQSKDTQYCLQVYTSVEESLRPLEVEVSPTDTYKDGKLTIGGKAIEGDLAMILHFSR